MDRLFLFIATGAGSGYLPKAPGTWASALTVLLWLLVGNFASFSTGLYLLFVGIVFFVGVASAGAAASTTAVPASSLSS